MSKRIQSNLFFEIYQNFNVLDQTQNIRQLSISDMYCLLVCCIDGHDLSDAMVKYNFKPFIKEITNILRLQEVESESESDQISIELNEYGVDVEGIKKKNIFGEKFSDNILSESGESLPKTYTISEVRELRLSNILTESRESRLNNILDK